MKNIDNKTSIIKEIDLTKYINLIENNPCHIATVSNKGKPNLSVASDVKVLDSKTLLISNNEMIHTPDNIIDTRNVVLTSFNDKWAGTGMTGVATYHVNGRYFSICNKLFNNETATPKGAIIIKIKKVEGIA